MTTPTVTIVIPTHNRCDLLKETIESLYSQTFDNWQLIIVDDASEDNTWSWLQTLNDNRIIPLRLEEHSERGKARNVGLDAAKGVLVLFLDDDDLLPKQALQIHVETLKRFPRAIASVGGRHVFTEKGIVYKRKLVERKIVRNVWKDAFFRWNDVSGQCLFRTQYIKSVNGWDESINLLEDVELFLRLGQLGPIVLIPDIVLLARRHDGQWRPANTLIPGTQIRENAVKLLKGRKRRVANRILNARSFFVRAFCEEVDSHPLKTLMLYIRALLGAPSMLSSPLVRPVIMAGILDSLKTLLRKMSYSLKHLFSASLNPIQKRED